MNCMRVMGTRSGLLCWSVLLACLAILGCSSTVPVEAEFPTPLVEPIDARVGVFLDQELRSFEYYEEIPQHSKWSIQLGTANVAMFEPLFASMFAETHSIDALPTEDSALSHLDGIVKPALDKFEFDVPRSSEAKFVEVWVRYRVALYQSDGTLITEWPVTGYGKAQAGRLGSSNSLRRAAVRALREVGANVATSFSNQPDVDAWLEEISNVQVSADRRPQS